MAEPVNVTDLELPLDVSVSQGADGLLVEFAHRRPHWVVPGAFILVLVSFMGLVVLPQVLFDWHDVDLLIPGGVWGFLCLAIVPGMDLVGRAFVEKQLVPTLIIGAHQLWIGDRACSVESPQTARWLTAVLTRWHAEQGTAPTEETHRLQQLRTRATQ